MKAKKSLGQNFLVNPGIVEKIISAAELTQKDTVLEIGPGTGVLTQALTKNAGRVVAIEKDHSLIESLGETFKDNKNVKIIEADALEFDPTSYKLHPTSYKIVANIPYYITSHLLRKIFSSWPLPTLIILMVQKEVAQRICAKPGDLNILALAVQYHATPSIVAPVSKGSFRPIPKVDSAILRLVPHEKRKGESEKGKQMFFDVIRAGFSAKRKKTLSNLIGAFPKQSAVIKNYFEKHRISPNIRSQDIALEIWTGLALVLSTL